MKLAIADRRTAMRHNFKVPIRIRTRESDLPEQRSESENLSAEGIFYIAKIAPAVGSAIEILLKMPEEITGEPTTEWLCSGRVVRVEPVDFPRGKLGVGVQFDSYQACRPLHAATV